MFLAKDCRTSDTFEPFPKLPTELQVKIWGYAVWIPRTIEVPGKHGTARNTTNDREAARKHSRSYRLSKRSCVPPAILHACHNSREEAQRAYKKYFFRPLRNKINKPREFSYTWSNPETDILLIGSSACERTMTYLFQDNNDLRKVIVMAEDEPQFYSDCRSAKDIITALHGKPTNASSQAKKPRIPEYLHGCRGLEEVFILSRSDDMT